MIYVCVQRQYLTADRVWKYDISHEGEWKMEHFMNLVLIKNIYIGIPMAALICYLFLLFCFLNVAEKSSEVRDLKAILSALLSWTGGAVLCRSARGYSSGIMCHWWDFLRSRYWYMIFCSIILISGERTDFCMAVWLWQYQLSCWMFLPVVFFHRRKCRSWRMAVYPTIIMQKQASGCWQQQRYFC